MDTKKCGKCGAVKALSDFYKGESPCKVCRAAHAKEYYKRKHEIQAVRRTCVRCWLTKPIVAFGKSLTACKECVNIYQAEYREKNRERRRVEAIERYKTHGHKHRAYSAEYRQINRDKLNARQREYAKQETVAERDRELRRLYSDKLTDAYVRRALTKRTPLKPKDIPQAMVEAKRAQLLITRRIKDGTNTRGQSQSQCEETIG